MMSENNQIPFLKSFAAAPKRVLVLLAMLLIALMLAFGSYSTTAACEGGTGLCPCPGCG